MKTILNVETGEEIIRELTDEELAQEKIDVAELEEKRQKKEAEKKLKTDKQNEIANRLGITPEELATLLS